MSTPPLFEDTAELDQDAGGRITMSVVLVESHGPRRCAHAAHIAGADDDDIADEWVRTLLAAAQLRGPYLLEAIRERMRQQ